MEYILIEKKASWLAKEKSGFLAITQEACFKDLLTKENRHYYHLPSDLIKCPCLIHNNYMVKIALHFILRPFDP